MVLMEFISQLQRMCGDPDGDRHLTGTILQYINEEIAYVCREFPEKATITWNTTTGGYYHTIDFTGLPVVGIEEIMVNGVGATKRNWKELRERIGNEV